MTAMKKPQVEAQMLIRKPITKVFQAFIDPDLTTHFWFTKSSGKLEKGKEVTWEWEMYKHSAKVLVKDIILNQLIKIEWGNPATSVDFIFEELDKDMTYVIINHYGFHRTGNELISDIKDSTGGFTTVLDGLKAYLEHDIELNLIADKFLKK